MTYDAAFDLDKYLEPIESTLAKATTDTALFSAIVNAPFKNPLAATQLDLGIVVLLLVDTTAGMLNRIALSDTYSARGAVRMSTKPFHTIQIPLDYSKNILVQTIESGKPNQTHDWKYLFAPALSPKEARFNQAGAGIECSHTYPLTSRGGGALIFSLYQPLSHQNDLHRAFMKRYCTMVDKALKR